MTASTPSSRDPREAIVQEARALSIVMRHLAHAQATIHPSQQHQRTELTRQAEELASLTNRPHSSQQVLELLRTATVEAIQVAQQTLETAGSEQPPAKKTGARSGGFLFWRSRRDAADRSTDLPALAARLLDRLQRHQEKIHRLSRELAEPPNTPVPSGQHGQRIQARPPVSSMTFSDSQPGSPAKPVDP
jgi:hypothetical protein